MRARAIVRMIGYALACAAVTAIAVVSIQPRIPPGYKPVLDRDERGLWMQLAEDEKDLQGSPKLVRDPAVNEYVYGVACKVAGEYCGDLRVYVLRNPFFNATMAANGMMTVWSGLLVRVPSEDALACVLGHEVAHFAMAHTLAQFRKLRGELAAGQILSMGLGAVTGVYAPVGENMAVLSSLAFSRESEMEADILGMQLVASAGYDPYACSEVWDIVMAEERHAAFKADGGVPLYLRTHPMTQNRSNYLRDMADDYGPPERPGHIDRHMQALAGEYFTFMEEQIDTNRYGRTGFLLDRHEELGVDAALVEFFRGEMYRQRGDAGDEELARAAYERSAESGACPAACYRNLGYLHLKQGDMSSAQAYFRRYLDAKPEATDREMIEFYLDEDG